MPDQITIRGARLHNLQNVTLAIPKGRLVVFTGLSGSGKSTLVLDIIHREGQRQYLESLGLVTWGAEPSAVEAIEGLSPTIAVDQNLANRSPRSTVGTATEVFTYLRVLFARLGHRPCPVCGSDVPPSQEAAAGGWEGEPDTALTSPLCDGESESYPCPHCGVPMPELTMAHFSFNKPEGACPTCTGLGVAPRVNADAVVDSRLSVRGGAVRGWNRLASAHYAESLEAAGRHYGFPFDADLPVERLGQVQRDLLLYGVRDARFQRHFPGAKPPGTVGRGAFEGVITGWQRRMAGHAHDPGYRARLEGMVSDAPCPDCGGTRLRAESREATVAGRTIVDLQRLPLSGLADWLEGLRAAVPPEEWGVAVPVVDDLRGRVRRLLDTGVGYLSLDRGSPSLSAGEAQRLRMASLLGSGLTGVIYVLDEPTVGLHPRDTARLIGVLRRLRDLGNSVLVIEHDLQVISAADCVVDMGPGAGRQGGRIVVAGTPEEVAACPESATGAYLSGRLSAPCPAARRPGSGQALVIRGAREHNLKNLTVRLPLGVLVAVTGVSGSGKSTLLFDILDRAARQRFSDAEELPGDHDGIEGWEQLEGVVPVDQGPIARSPRSNAATYIEAWTPIREAFAASPEAQREGLGARHFSFNLPGGRCERCEGAGVLSVEMHFLANVQVRCPACGGRRFRREVLAAKIEGYDVSQVLEMPVEQALLLFRGVPAAAARLELAVEAGLGYLPLGQPATSLSGGEAQRVKLARELARRGAGRTLYLLDEPTTGLHSADVAGLLALLRRLVDAGNSVVVVEHNLDVVRAADWIIDLGPEGGDAGGYLVAEGTPEQVALVEASAAGAALRG